MLTCIVISGSLARIAGVIMAGTKLGNGVCLKARVVGLVLVNGVMTMN